MLSEFFCDPKSRTWAQINTDALIHNLKAIKAANPHKKIISVVKANAYGHDVNIVAPAIEDLSDMLMVAEINEALELRALGIKKPILIAGYTPCQYADLLEKESLVQCVYSLDYARALNENAKSTIKVHLKINTGMERLGFDPKDITSELLKELSSLKKLKIDGIFTHYAESDNCGSDFSSLQTKSFIKALEILKDLKPEYIHCSNSAAAMSFSPEFATAIRPGIMLYGCYPSKEIEKLWLENKNPPLRPVMSLFSRIIQLRSPNEGDSVGYNRRFFAKENTKIAVICAGYADGLPRLLAYPESCKVIDNDTELVGSVCMDMCFADISRSKKSFKEGDAVELFGENLSVELWAKAAKTISYEIFCQITKRVKRIEVKDK